MKSALKLERTVVFENDKGKEQVEVFQWTAFGIHQLEVFAGGRSVTGLVTFNRIINPQTLVEGVVPNFGITECAAVIYGGLEGARRRQLKGKPIPDTYPYDLIDKWPGGIPAVMEFCGDILRELVENITGADLDEAQEAAAGDDGTVPTALDPNVQPTGSGLSSNSCGSESPETNSGT